MTFCLFTWRTAMLGENGGNQQEEEGASKKRGKLLSWKDEKTDNLKFVLSTTLLSWKRSQILNIFIIVLQRIELGLCDCWFYQVGFFLFGSPTSIPPRGKTKRKGRKPAIVLCQFSKSTLINLPYVR